MSVAELRRWSAPDGRSGQRLWLFCPGCDDLHWVEVESQPRWDWDGNLAAPTISPSIKVTGVQWGEAEGFHKPTHHVAAGEPTCCHSFVRDGRWEFQPDCTHHLAGQTVPLPELSDHRI